MNEIPADLQPVAERLQERLLDWAALAPLVAVAAAVFAIFCALAWLVGRSDRPYRWMSDNLFVRDLLRQLVRGLVVLVGLVLALEVVDATALIGAALGTAGVLGLAMGFALRDIVENYVASVLLSIRQPFRPNDHVIVDGVEGKIVRLTTRATILMTFDGNHVRIPNSVVFKSTMTNFSSKPERRLNFDISVGVDVDLLDAQQTGLAVLGAMRGVLAKPAPVARIESLDDSTVTLRFFAWVHQQRADFGKVRSEALRLVKNAFDERGIEMPEPTQRLRIEALQAAEDTSKPANGEPASAKRPGDDHSGASRRVAFDASGIEREQNDISPDSELAHEIHKERMGEPDLLDTNANRE